MTLGEFIENFVGRNTLIRLWRKIKGGHQMIYLKNKDKPSGIDAVCMEWEILNGSTWQTMFKDNKVLYVKDIVVDDSYREAVNIVIDDK